METRAQQTLVILKWTFGLVPIVAGLDKFTNLLTDWGGYVSPSIAALLPFSVPLLMKLVGVVEIAAGVLVLSPLTRIGGYVVAGWLVAVAVQLAIAGRFDVAVRDVVMAIAAFSLARLAEARSAETASHAGAATARTAHA